MFLETKELPVTTPAKVGQYHELAEAMRRGAARLPEVHGPLFETDEKGRICAACAFGTLAYALYGEECVDDGMRALQAFNLDLMSRIVNRFEDHHHTREQIADWLDTL